MRNIFNILVVLLFILTYAGYSYPQNTNNARIGNVVISNNNQGITVSFEVKSGFTKEIEEAINSGIPTPFTFIVELYRNRSFWFNEKLTEYEFRHSVKYDTLKAEYEVVMEEKNQHERIIRLKDLSSVKEVMSKVEGLQLYDSAKLQKNNKYTVKIKAKLDTVNLFFPLNYMLFFVSFWDFETEWYEETFNF
ncbi:MAG: hypothetical protein A2073_00045 [Deltaproteobacteria bacterium GWC2_42_11]|nr:MAG: hypothetical protein A2073_00045 [Deltaproteobacteria bacterium GWC2_42_11]HBO84817.1 hypothetical protein [Deltaproteobacteria bacterium]